MFSNKPNWLDVFLSPILQGIRIGLRVAGNRLALEPFLLRRTRDLVDAIFVCACGNTLGQFANVAQHIWFPKLSCSNNKTQLRVANARMCVARVLKRRGKCPRQCETLFLFVWTINLLLFWHSNQFHCHRTVSLVKRCVWGTKTSWDGLERVFITWTISGSEHFDTDVADVLLFSFLKTWGRLWSYSSSSFMI